MAKKLDAKNFIHFELEKLENKVQEFQKYLELNSIIYGKGGLCVDELEEDVQDKLHKEIVIQIKMQDALFNWLPLLEKLRETDEDKKPETRGNVEISPLFT